MQQTLSVSQAACMAGITSQAIYLAIDQGKLKCRKVKKKNAIRIEIDMEDYRKYRLNLYSRAFSKRNGKLIYDAEHVNPAGLSKLLGIPEQRIYYMVRTGQLAHTRNGCAIVISISDARKKFGLQDV